MTMKAEDTTYVSEKAAATTAENTTEAAVLASKSRIDAFDFATADLDSLKSLLQDIIKTMDR